MIEDSHRLGEVLRAAREAKGADLAQVERETKIRQRYLSALELGEYRELPGAVYTRGFLRNYAAFLDLDPEYLIDLYRLENVGSASDRASVPHAPRPISVRRRRTFVVTPGAVAAAILTVLVGALVAWLVYEFVNFARTPDLVISDPPGDVSAHTGSTITIRGTTAPNATVMVRGLPENPSAIADADGVFQITVNLLPGSNEIHLSAFDPVTNRTSEEFIRRVNVVADVPVSPSAEPAAVTLEAPEADTATSGPIAVRGTAPTGSQVTVSAVVVTPAAPSFTVADAAGQTVELTPEPATTPEPLVLEPDTTGAFAGTLSLAPGTWDVTVGSATGPAQTRRVTVAPEPGLRATLQIEGGDSYLELEQDGEPVAGISGGIGSAGDDIDLAAERTLRVRAGNAGAVRLTVNGISLGAMGGNGAVVEWQITRSGG